MIGTQFEAIVRRLTTILAVVIITLTLIGATSGILLSFYYEPASGAAYNSLKMINTELSFGWLFRKAHEVAGHGVIAIALVQIVLMFVSRQFSKSWLIAWVSGILFTLSAIGLAWTAMILDWDQLGYWRFSLELGTIEAIPLIGSQIRDILTGGAINTITVQHLYTIHSYIVSFAAIILAVVHLVGVFLQEKQMYVEATKPEVTDTSMATGSV
jgi:cytochrome b6